MLVGFANTVCKLMKKSRYTGYGRLNKFLKFLLGRG
jgi:hypothetical protein